MLNLLRGLTKGCSDEKSKKNQQGKTKSALRVVLSRSGRNVQFYARGVRNCSFHKENPATPMRRGGMLRGHLMRVAKRTTLLFAVLVVSLAATKPMQAETEGDPKSAVPEMDRLARALLGDWNTTETMERSELFPNGGERHGIVHVRLAAGGTTLIYEVHSDGSAGKLDGMLVIWWDKDASLYRFFICFNNPNHPCKMRGTAHWQDDSFVNDYEEVAKGKKTSWRDSLTFTPTSHTLVAAMQVGGAVHTLITTSAVRR
jgi:hypothetical protein